jgi:hypothetical protein
MIIVKFRNKNCLLINRFRNSSNNYRVLRLEFSNWGIKIMRFCKKLKILRLTYRGCIKKRKCVLVNKIKMSKFLIKKFNKRTKWKKKVKK